MKISSHHRFFFLAALVVAGLLPGCNRDPNVAKQRFLQSGIRYYNQGKYKEAGIQFQNAVKIDPRFAEAHLQMAHCYEKLEIWSGAYQELLKTVDIQPDNNAARVELGNLLLSAHRYSDAKDQADAILGNDPRNVDGRILRADAFASLGDLNAALREAQIASEIAPNRADGFLSQALTLAALGKTADAEANFKKAFGIDRSSRVASVFGSFYDGQARPSDAEQMYLLAVQLSPKDPDFRQQLALHYLRASQPEKAEAVLRQAKKDFPDDSTGYRMLGEFYVGQRQTDKALAEYDSLHREHPKDLQVEKGYIELLIEAGKYDEATKLIDSIVKAIPKDTDAMVYRAEILTRQGKASDSIPLLDSVTKTDPDSAIAHYELAEAYRVLGDSGRAELELRQAIHIQPNLLPAQLQLAQIAAAKHDPSSLSSSADEIISLRPQWPEGYAFRAEARLASGDVARAEADAQKAIDLAPDRAIGYVAMSEIRFAQKRFADAQRLCEQALEHDPNYVQALGGIVASYEQQKEPAKAIERVGSQIAKSPNNADYEQLYARLLMDAKRYEEAEAAAQKAVDINGSDSVSILLLAAAQAHRGELDKEAASYEAAIKANPRDARTYFYYASLEDSRGNWQKAEDLDQKALQMQPEFALAANDLAFLMLDHGGNVDLALSIAQKARQEAPDNPNFADTLAWAYYQKGAYQSAIDLLHESVKKYPQVGVFHYHLGMAYQKVNDKPHARLELQRFLQLTPNDSHSGDARKALSELG